tara:strand:+ start:3034 stop:3531 length:498 start_codon:yes stop_codon:yes gene_type:complete
VKTESLAWYSSNSSQTPKLNDMKNLVLGMMIVATSIVYAQDFPVMISKDIKKIDLKDYKPQSRKHITDRKFAIKQVRKYDIVRDVAVDRREFHTGVVRIINGKAVVVLSGDLKHNRVYAVNLHKASKIDGTLLRFRMRDSRGQIPPGVKAHKVVILEEVSVLKQK